MSVEQYLLQKIREGRFAECLKQQSDRVEINTWDLWVGFEVDVITMATNKHDYLWTICAFSAASNRMKIGQSTDFYTALDQTPICFIPILLLNVEPSMGYFFTEHEQLLVSVGHTAGGYFTQCRQRRETSKSPEL